MIRWGLCCIFRDEPIKFSSTTAKSLGKLERPLALQKLAEICLKNAAALRASLQFCVDHGIGCFRINSQILPLKTHPIQGYAIEELPAAEVIVGEFQRCGQFVRAHGLRTCFHPDQFVVLNSPRADVVAASVREIEYQAEVSEWVGADVINVHVGGVYGDKGRALATFADRLDLLSDRARRRLTVENDDRSFSPADLLPFSRQSSVPLVYDVHHHRCHADELSEMDATGQAIATWDREPIFHISSPARGWSGPRPQCHHDYIHVQDFPRAWLDLDITVEVEAKAKEVAIARLRRDLGISSETLEASR